MAVAGRRALQERVHRPFPMGIVKHGLCHGNIDARYRIWQMMIQRCHNPRNKRFGRYGARGIKVCDRWRNPVNGLKTFVSDMGPRPLRASIERINNNGNYEPGNCRWATIGEQTRNTVQNVLITWNGETKCAADWEAALGISRFTIYSRIRQRWPPGKLLIPPMHTRDLRRGEKRRM
jgi:hypothetical protein